MPKRSAGLLMYQRMPDGVRVLLVHPGGPLWVNKDRGAWSIPKGEYGGGEDPLAVALREFEEETGARPRGPFHPLGEVRQTGGKQVVAFALEGEFDPSAHRSNSFELEWPPRSGRRQSFPEVDRADWFALPVARDKILPAQRALIDRLAVALESGAFERNGKSSGT